MRGDSRLPAARMVFLGPRTEIQEMYVQPQQIQKPASLQHCFAVGSFLPASVKGVEPDGRSKRVRRSQHLLPSTVSLWFSNGRCRLKKVAKPSPRSPGGLSPSVLNPSQAQAAHTAPATSFMPRGWRCRLLQVSLMAGCLASEGATSCLTHVVVSLVEKVLETPGTCSGKAGRRCWALDTQWETWALVPRFKLQLFSAWTWDCLLFWIYHCIWKLYKEL